MQGITFVLSEEDVERMEEVCQKHGMTIQEFLTTAVEESLQVYENMEE